MKVEKPLNLTVDGVDYPVASFNETIQRLVEIHTVWRQELADERLALTKTEAAIRAVDQELAQLVAAELTKKNEVAAESPADVGPEH